MALHFTVLFHGVPGAQGTRGHMAHCDVTLTLCCCRAQVVYRRYASLFFIVGLDGDENELAALELIHCLVEALDKYFGNVVRGASLGRPLPRCSSLCSALTVRARRA